MQNSFALRVFHALFAEARRSRPPTQARLSSLLGASPEAVFRALRSLERAGLVDAERGRLTMHGLVVAAATAPGRSQAARSRDIDQSSLPSRAIAA